MANKLTIESGLTFNVNTIKNKLKDFFKSQELETPMFSTGKIAVAAALEKLFEILLTAYSARGNKEKNGIKTIRLELATSIVQLTPDLKDYYSSSMQDKYDEKQMYLDQVPVIKSEMDQVMNRIDKEMVLSHHTYNYTCFLLLKAFLDIATGSDILLRHEGKKTLSATCVSCVIQMKFPSGLAQQLCTEITRAVKTSGNDAEEEAAEEEKQEEEEPKKKGSKGSAKEEKEEVKKPKKTDTKKAEPSKKSAGKKSGKAEAVKQIEEEVAEAEDEDNQEEETVVQAKPRKSSANKDTKAPKKTK